MSSAAPQIRNQSYELVAVEALTQHPDNPNQGDVGAIVGSMEANGIYGALVVQAPRGNRKRGRILAGNHRWLAAKAAGVPEVPVVWVDVDDERATRIMLADNQTANLASYDDGALAALLVELAATAEGLTGTAFDADDLDDLLASLEDAPGGPQPGDDDLPAQPPAKTVLGDVWLLGPHRLLCGNATEPTDVDKVLAGELAVCVFTDPPYNVAYEGGTADRLTIANDDLSDEDFDTFLFDAFVSMRQGMEPGAAIYVCHADGSGGAFRNTFERSGLLLKQVLIWVKNQFVLSRQDYNWQHEPILYGWNPGAAHNWYGPFSRSTVIDDDKADLDNLSKAQLIEMLDGYRKQSTVVREDRPSRSEDHPTMKPVRLITRLLLNNTRHGDVVLDPFGGSGSTLIAAHQIGRRARVIELDPGYCDVICARFQKITGTLPVAESTGREHDFSEVTDATDRPTAEADGT